MCIPLSLTTDVYIRFITGIKYNDNIQTKETNKEIINKINKFFE